MLSTNIHIVDLIVVAIYVVGVVLFGVWIGRGQRDLNSYLLGGRDLPWWAILGSIVATETSTATFLSVPGIAFVAATKDQPSGNLCFLQLTFGYIVGRAVIVVFLLPLYFKGQLFTAYQVLEHRFGGRTKQVASLVFLVARNLGDGLRLFLTAIVLEKVAGVPLPWCVIAIGAATIVYTFFGGMKSVVFNDCIQFVVYMIGGGIAAWIIIQQLPDGWTQFVEFGKASNKFQVLDFSADVSKPYTFWAGLIGGMFLTIGTHGTDQMLVQRYLCARSQRAAATALFLSGFVVLLQFTFFLLLGVGLACYYGHFHPSVTFDRGDEVLASFIVNEMPMGVGVIGIVLAAVFSAAMSTLSSSLNSSSAALVNDFYLPLSRKQPSSARLVWISCIFTVVFGVIQIIIGIAASYVSGSVVSNALAIAGFSAGLLLGVFALGVLTRSVSQSAALVGLTGGLAALVSVKFGGWAIELLELPQNRLLSAVTTLAWPWYALVGCAATMICGLTASLFIDNRSG